MKLFYNVSQKRLLQVRNELFVNRGIPALRKNGFDEAPFPGSWFGRNNLKDYTYELCRINEGSRLEMITTHISRGDRWIKIFLNIFQLSPELRSLEQLANTDGMQFHLPPNSRSSMRLDTDSFRGMPLFNMKAYKIRSYFTESGFQRRAEKLGRLIERDLTNIDLFVRRWYELHPLMKTNWEGKIV